MPRTPKAPERLRVHPVDAATDLMRYLDAVADMRGKLHTLVSVAETHLRVQRDVSPHVLIEGIKDALADLAAIMPEE